MGKPSMLPMVMILVNVLLGSFGQLSLKYGVSKIGTLCSTPGLPGMALGALKAFVTPYVFLGLAMYAISAILWLNILSQVRLSIAYPMISLSYVLVVVLSSVLLREKVHAVTIAGLVFICLGVSLIGAGYSAGR